MALRYVLDENLRGPLWAALRRSNHRRAVPLEIACVGEETELRFGMSDPEHVKSAGRQVPGEKIRGSPCR
jgi:hypothetical protein